MPNLDYLVMTLPEINSVQALEPVFRRLVKGGKKAVRNGYEGDAVPGIFFGYNAFARRYLLIGTGSSSEEVAQYIPEYLDSYASFARLDVQTTTPCSDPDGLILSLFPSSRYSGTFIKPYRNEGVTLYIGAPKSRLRCRVYNKTAESGVLSPTGDKLLRVEWQLRDDYADRTWVVWREGKLAEACQALAAKMFSEASYQAISAHLEGGLPLDYLRRTLEADEDEVARRLRWIEGTVVPSLNKLLARYPDAAERVKDALAGLPLKW